MSCLHYRAVAGVLCTFLLAATANAQEYKIKLMPPDKVGDTYTIAATGKSSISSTMTVTGADPQKSEIASAITLDGTVTVLAIDKTDQATKLSCTVTKSSMDGKPLYDAGTVIVAENKDGKTQYTVDGAKADPSLERALDMILATHNPDDTSDGDDAVFGTDQLQKVGATWPVNAGNAAASAAQQGIPLKKEDITGSVKLVAAKQVNGQQVLQIEGDFKAANMQGTLSGAPPLIGGTLAAHFGGLFPTAPGKRRTGQTESIHADLHFKGQTPDGKSFTMDIVMSRSMDMTIGMANK